VIREATPADAFAIGRVHVQSWLESYRGLVPDGWLAQLDVDGCGADWMKRLSEMDPPTCCFVALDDAGEITGFVNAGPTRDDEIGRHGEIYAIYLIERMKRRGVGRALMSAAVSRLHEAGFRSVCLWFLKENPARAFYERFGGRVVAERPFSRFGFTSPSLGYVWDNIDELFAALGPTKLISL
jgi:ribosomal protein S18 acetylase RimI-like enzyme